MHDVGDDDGEAESDDAEVDDHGPLAEREGARGQRHAARDAGDDGQAEGQHDGEHHERDGDLPEGGVVEVAVEDLDRVHAEVGGHERDRHVDGDEEAHDAGDLALFEFFERFGLDGSVSCGIHPPGGGVCRTCC